MQYLCLDRGKVLISAFCWPFISDFCSFIVRHVLYFPSQDVSWIFTSDIWLHMSKIGVNFSREHAIFLVLSKIIWFDLNSVIDKWFAYRYCPVWYKAEHLSTVWMGDTLCHFRIQNIVNLSNTSHLKSKKKGKRSFALITSRS